MKNAPAPTIPYTDDGRYDDGGDDDFYGDNNDPTTFILIHFRSPYHNSRPFTSRPNIFRGR